MNTTGKIVAVVCIFSTLFAGCYTSTVVTSETPKLDNDELVFTLLWMKQDAITYVYKRGEAYVRSNQHHRIENGYEVTGTIVTPQDRAGKDFSGVLYDDQIKEVTFSEYDAVLTWTIIGGVVAGIVVFLATLELNMQTLP